ncbi:MAG: 30S ribosomal protein S8 [bacterium]
MDPIADLLNRIRNAQAVLLPTVEVPFSNLKYEICQILQREGFIGNIEKKGKKVRKTLEITLKYANKEPVISGIKKISNPGQRIYLPVTKVRRVKEGFGIAIISTSKGLKTDKEARKERLGGEIIAKVW